MTQGFLCISRDVVEWDWYTDANTFRVFMHLLLTASYKDCSYKGLTLRRGQVATSRGEIAKALRMSEQNVRTSLSHLKSTNEITTTSTNKLTIVTICKYDSWQNSASDSNQQTNQQDNHKLTSNQPAIEEKGNKLNKEKEDTKVSSQKKNWREDYDAYIALIDEALSRLYVDEEYKRQMEQLYVNIDYKRTLVACSLYWKRSEQWEAYKRKRTQKPNFVSAIKNGFHINKVYISKYQEKTDDFGYPKSVDDVKEEDNMPTYEYYTEWVYRRCRRLFESLKGFPQSTSAFQNLADHTIGGTKALCYVTLVLNRDGWEKYDSPKGFMFIYSNYIKANGLFKE